jgi:hypothetical protein
MRTQVSWSLALMALVMSGSLITGCKSSKHGRMLADGGYEEDGGDGPEPDGGDTPGGSGFTLSKTSGLRTEEGGATDTFTIALKSKPTADVTLRVSSSDEGEGKVSPTTLVFTTTDWSAPKTITVTGQQDEEQDGEQAFSVVFAAAESTDSAYAGKKPGDVSAVNVDDDTAGVSLLGAASLFTSEPNVSTTYRLKLNTKPTANVALALTSSDTGEVTVAPGTVTFTADNWNAEQTVTLTGVDDPDLDGAVTVKIASAVTSTDARYMGLSVPEVSVINKDNETAGFFVVPTSGLRVFEDNRRGDSFTVALNTKPTANVTIPVSSSKVGEATATPSTLTFTPDNWAAPQSVSVVGVDDMAADGDQVFNIVLGVATSQDVRYQGSDPADVAGVNVDDESAGFSVANLDLTAKEGGKTGSFTLELNGKPTADVTVAVSSLTTAQATVSPASLTFTVANYRSPQKVTVTAVDDTVADGSQQVTVDLGAAVSADARYSTKKPDNVVVTVEDNDSAGLDVVPVDLTTDETGGKGSITVALAKKPTATVTVPVSSSDEGEITVSPKTLTFTVDNWRSAQTVTLTGVTDDLIDGNQNATITVGPSASADATYVGKTQTLVATNVDKDTAGAVIEPATPLVTDESGNAPATFKVKLTKQPTANVKVKLTVSKPEEATISVAELTFKPDDFASPQSVVVNGLSDMGVADGDQPFLVSFDPAESTDINYNGLVIRSVLATNVDLDSPGILTSFDPLTPANPNEVGGTKTFNVRLKSKPTAPVTLQFASSNQSEGQVLTTQIVIPVDQWQGSNPITVKGQDDLFDDGDQPFQVTIVSASTDPKYAGLQAAVDFLNEDDDQAGFSITYDQVLYPTPLTTGEDNSSTKFYVALRARPMADVVIPLTSTKPTEGTVIPAALTFTRDDWNSPHEVTVTGVGDLKADGDAIYYVNFGQATGDAVYAALTPNAPIELTNFDTDSAGIFVSHSGVSTTEDGAQLPATTISIRLRVAPTGNVTIPLSVSDVSEAALNAGSVTFTTANFASPQTVTVTGLNDDVADGNIAYQVVFGPAQSNDVAYAGRVVAALPYINYDNDTAGIAIVPDPSLGTLVTTEGDPTTTSFGVRLLSEPVGTVTVTVTASNNATGEVTFGPSTMTFTAANYANAGAPHEVTIASVDDLVADGPQTYTLQVAVTSAPDDENYRNLPPPAAVNGRNDDDDSVGIRLRNPPVVLNTNEGQATDTFQVRLNSRPTAPVTLSVVSSATSEAEVLTSSVTFNTAASGTGSFAEYQTVTVRGVNDDFADGNAPFTITVTADPAGMDAKYAALAPVVIPGTNDDDDSPGVRIFDANRVELFSPYSLPDLLENGSNPFTFYVSLSSKPFNAVSIPIASSDLGEVTIDTAELLFDGDNWATLHPVNAVGINDAIDDGNANSSIVLATPISQDVGYANALLGKSLAVQTIDDDSAGIIVSTPSSTVTYEEGTTATFTVKLNSEPTEDVIIDLASSDTSEGTVSPAVLTFTAGNWAAAQTVTVTSVNDHTDDGTTSYDVILTTRASTELSYNARAVPASPLGFSSLEVSTSCATLQATVRTVGGTQLPSGTYTLDPDSLAGPIARFTAYCDMATVSDGITGGWTLLSWTGDSESLGGVPYPGVDYVDPSAVPAMTIRASAVPAGAVDALFDLSSELAQAQAITATGLGAVTQFDDLSVYESVGAFKYGSLANLTIAAPAGCSGLTVGTYTTIKDPDNAALNNGVQVFLNQGLHYADDAALSNFSSGQQYVWSVGNRTAYCALNGTPPASFVGTWQDAQYGPRYQNTAGAYSVWVR